jgi:hypothetical protein
LSDITAGLFSVKLVSSASAWRACSSAARRSVRSRVILAKPSSSPLSSWIASSAVSAQNRLPSLRSRQPSSVKRPVRRAVSSARRGLPAARS